MPDVIILVFRKRGIYCFRGQKRCVLSNFKDRKRQTFYSAGKKRWKSWFLILTLKTRHSCILHNICREVPMQDENDRNGQMDEEEDDKTAAGK